MNKEQKKSPKILRSNKGYFAFLIFCCFLGKVGFAQKAEKDSLTGWKQERKLGVLINQSSYDNWLAGGVNSFSGTLNFDYSLAFQTEKWAWDSTLAMALGYARTAENNRLNKTEDQLELNTVLQRRTKKGWGFSSSFNLKTQNAPGYSFVEENQATERVKTSAFFSPAYLRLGLGMAYKKEQILALQINPLTARLIVVDQFFTQNLASGEQFFGVDADKTTRWEAGASIDLQSKITLAKNVTLGTNISLVANYLEEFKNIDLDATTTLDMKVNDYLSALFEVQFLYDDNAIADLQFRQVFGVAISIPF